MKKSLWLTISALIMMAVLSACTAPPVAMDTTDDALPAINAPVQSLAALTVDVETASSDESLDIWADETRAPIMATIGRQLTAATGVPVTVTELPFDDIRREFESAAPVGAGPDIIVGSYGWLGQLVNDGLVAEVDLGDKTAQFLDSAVDAFELDGVLYGMPYATENVALVYNPELVPEPPATWRELTAISAQLEDEGKVLQGFMRQTGDPYHFYPTESAFGGYIFGDDDEGYDLADIGAESEGTLAAFQWLDQMYAEGHLNPETVVDYDIMHDAFEAGHTAMIVTGPWALPRLRASGVPFVVTTLPAETQAATPFLGVQGFMVSRFSENPELAQRFLTDVLIATISVG